MILLFLFFLFLLLLLLLLILFLVLFFSFEDFVEFNPEEGVVLKLFIWINFIHNFIQIEIIV